MQTPLQHDLIDQMNLWIDPVLLGGGKRLFAEGTSPTAPRVLESTTFATGTVLLLYQRADKRTYGDMAWDAQQTEPSTSQ